MWKKLFTVLLLVLWVGSIFTDGYKNLNLTGVTANVVNIIIIIGTVCLIICLMKKRKHEKERIARMTPEEKAAYDLEQEIKHDPYYGMTVEEYIKISNEEMFELNKEIRDYYDYEAKDDDI